MKRIIGLLTALAFVGFTGSASANETTLQPGESSECIKAGWIAYNSSESQDTTLEFNIGPVAYGWGKVQKNCLDSWWFRIKCDRSKNYFQKQRSWQRNC